MTRTREQIYSQEAASILRDISMYKALEEEQLLRLYPGKEKKVKNLLAYLERQKRICREGHMCFADSECAEHIDRGLVAAVWVLVDFIEQVEYHSVGDYPAKLIFFAGGEIYEVIHAEQGREALMSYVLGKPGEQPSRYLILVDSPEQISELDISNASGYCTVSAGGAVQYYQKDSVSEV